MIKNCIIKTVCYAAGIVMVGALIVLPYIVKQNKWGWVVELVDTGDLKSPDFGRAGSIPALATFLIFFVDKRLKFWYTVSIENKNLP